MTADADITPARDREKVERLADVIGAVPFLNEIKVTANLVCPSEETSMGGLSCRNT